MINTRKAPAGNASERNIRRQPLGQRVKSFGVYYKEEEDSAWKLFKNGTTIGHKRILLTDRVSAVAVKLSITGSLACPVLNGFGLYNDTVSGLTDSDLDK